MKKALIFMFVLIALQTKAQTTTWTLTKAVDTIKALQKDLTAIKAKLVVKDRSDDTRNNKLDSLFAITIVLAAENKDLKARLDKLKVYYLSPIDFTVGTDSIAKLKPRFDTVIIKH